MRGWASYLILLVVLLSSCETKRSTPQAMAVFFIEQYQKIGSDALYAFFENSSYTPSVNELSRVKAKIDSVTGLLGTYQGYTLITRNEVSKDFVMLSYLVKYERQPVRFNLIYYRPSKVWSGYNFSFDTDIKEELQYSSKIYFLNRTFK